MPSQADIAITARLKKILDPLEVQLVEHFVVAECGAMAI